MQHMNAMTYKGYAARIEYDADDRIFVGHVLGIKDIISFHGATVEEMETAFRQSVDDYLAACEQLGQKADRPFSGKLMLRTPLNCTLALREIARRVDRDVSSVHADVHVLLNAGIIDRRANGFIFPYDAVHVDFLLKAG